jgi:hypothetical protein
VKLIRIATTSDQTGTPGFDSEEMLEAGDYPGGLSEILGRLGIGAKPSAEAPPAPAPAPVAKPAPAVVAAKPVPAAAAAAGPKLPAPAAAPRAAAMVPSSDPAIAAAERLARIAVGQLRQVSQCSLLSFESHRAQPPVLVSQCLAQ